MTDTLLAARGVSFAWPGGPPLFQHLDIQLRRGEVLAVSLPARERMYRRLWRSISMPIAPWPTFPLGVFPDWPECIYWPGCGGLSNKLKDAQAVRNKHRRIKI